MSKILYVDAAAGLSGDMLAGALLDLGWPLEELRGLVEAMGLSGVALADAAAPQGALAARRLSVEVSGHQPHRHLSDVAEILGRLPSPVAGPALRVFERLAGAEAAVHGCAVEEVHFHEVGAADALVDVTAFCAGLAWLGGPRLVCSPLPLGRGFVDCAHGRLPLPAPAVLKLLEGAPVETWPEEGETVTPTGAALVSTLAESFGPLPAMRLERCGVGGGSRVNRTVPNVCRLLLGEAAVETARDQVAELVCHLDDMSPEDLPLVIERLMAAGALDAAAAPLYMKKGRPGLMLTVLAPPERAEEMAGLVLEQTTSLGLRLSFSQRRMLAREQITVDTPWGPVKVKRAGTSGGPRLHPEADEVARISAATGLAPHVVRQAIVDRAR